MIQISSGVSGRFMIQTAKADPTGAEVPGSRVVVAPWQDNLITDSGMDYMGGSGAQGNYFMNYLSVGSGATPPAFTDTSLQARVATTGSSNTTTDGYTTEPPYYSWYRREFQFGVGAAAGTLSELGLTNNSGTEAYTRALIKDEGGNPATITVLPDELLIVTYERRVYPHTEDVVTSAVIKGEDITVTIRPSNIASSSGRALTNGFHWSSWNSGGYWYSGGTGVGPITGQPSGARVAGSSKTDISYEPGTYYRDQVMGLSVQALAGTTITGFQGWNSETLYQIGFQPGIPKTDAETVALRLRMSWSRYDP